MADAVNMPGSGTPVVSANRVRLVNEAVRVGPERPGGHGKPRVEVIREHDVVRAVEVICPCGERIVVRCDYE
jgi:hypothetical protein